VSGAGYRTAGAYGSGAVTFDVVGDYEVAQGFLRSAVTTEMVVPNALMHAGFVLEREMKLNVQRMHIIDTGTLLNSIGITEVDGNSILVGPHVDYAAYQEFGTYAQEPRPFVRPAVESKRDQINRIIGGEVVMAVEAAFTGSRVYQTELPSLSYHEALPST
jgi:HK97 gp10 family phage protein